MGGKNNAAAADHGRGEHTAFAGATDTGGWRVDPPGQIDNEHSQRPDAPPGLIGKNDQTIAGADADETLQGGLGDDSLSGGGGNDTLTGGEANDTLSGGLGGDELSGGGGADTFVAEHTADTVDGLDRVTDFTAADDQLQFTGGPAATDANFATATAADFDAAVLAAQDAVTNGAAYVAVEVGGDVLVFADTDGDPTTLDAALVLVGKTLADVTVADFG